MRGHFAQINRVEMYVQAIPFVHGCRLGGELKRVLLVQGRGWEKGRLSRRGEMKVDGQNVYACFVVAMFANLL